MQEKFNPLSESVQKNRADKTREWLEYAGAFEIIKNTPPEYTYTVEGMITAQPEHGVNQHDNTFMAVELDDYYQGVLQRAFTVAEHTIGDWDYLLRTSKYLGVRVISEQSENESKVTGVDFSLFDREKILQTPLLITRIKPEGNGRKGAFIFSENILLFDEGNENSLFRRSVLENDEAAQYLVNELVGTLDGSPFLPNSDVEEIADAWTLSQRYALSASEIKAMRELAASAVEQLGLDIDN